MASQAEPFNFNKLSGSGHRYACSILFSTARVSGLAMPLRSPAPQQQAALPSRQHAQGVKPCSA